MAGSSNDGKDTSPVADPNAGREPPISFATFLISLASSVVIHLGEAPSPETQKVEKNLPMAKQTIDLLSILQDRTRGNLSSEEQQLLQSLLYDLRVRYVNASRPG